MSRRREPQYERQRIILFIHHDGLFTMSGHFPSKSEFFRKNLFLLREKAIKHCQNFFYMIKFILSVLAHARTAMEISKHMVDLVSNSIEALAKHVLIMLSAEEGGIALEVTDDGEGISAQDVAAAFRGEKAPRGRGLLLLKETAEKSGGSFAYASTGKGSTVRAVFHGVPLGAVGDALLVFWQEMPITVITLSAVTEKGGFVFDSRLIGTKYGDSADIDTMVKVRKDVNYTLTNLFGGM